MDRTSQKIILDILLFMGERGLRYRTSEIEDVLYYTERMYKDDRIITIYDGETLNTVVFFSICNDYLNYLIKPTWIYKEHDKNGSISYIEKIVSVSYNKELRLLIEQLIISKYPSATIGKWHVWGKLGDRESTTKEYLNVTV